MFEERYEPPSHVRGAGDGTMGEWIDPAILDERGIRHERGECPEVEGTWRPGDEARDAAMLAELDDICPDDSPWVKVIAGPGTLVEVPPDEFDAEVVERAAEALWGVHRDQQIAAGWTGTERWPTVHEPVKALRRAQAHAALVAAGRLPVEPEPVRSDELTDECVSVDVLAARFPGMPRCRGRIAPGPVEITDEMVEHVARYACEPRDWDRLDEGARKQWRRAARGAIAGMGWWLDGAAIRHKTGASPSLNQDAEIQRLQASLVDVTAQRDDAEARASKWHSAWLKQADRAEKAETEVQRLLWPDHGYDLPNESD